MRPGTERDLSGRPVNRMTDSQLKYNLIRQRFLDHFYFEGRVAVSVSPGVLGDSIVFGDQTIYLGQALLFFASEIAVLRRSGQDVSRALLRLDELLNGIEELERKGNERYGGGGGASGFFVRDDITGPDDPRLGGRFHAVASDWQFPEFENDTPSGDQIFGLMYGLLAVINHSSDARISSKAKAISSRLFEYAFGTDFILRKPNGEATRRGSDMRWLASLLHGVNQAVTGEDRFNEARIDVGGVRLPLDPIAAFWDSSLTPLALENVIGLSLPIPVLGEDVQLNAFAIHILLMALSSGEVWSQAELERVALKANHHLAILLYCQAHAGRPAGLEISAAERIVDACPDTGPHAGLNADTGWQHDNRWIRCTDIFSANDGEDAFNGLDWLVFYNYCQLAFDTTLGLNSKRRSHR
jgi:hypothetical protein